MISYTLSLLDLKLEAAHDMNEGPQVAIIGAGIAGSVLASILCRRKIPTILIDKAVPAPSLTYACSIQKRTMDKLAATVGGGDEFLGKSMGLASPSTTSTLGDVYVHRGVLGELLRERAPGVIQAEATAVSTNPLVITLSDGRKIQPQVLVAADGPHSSVRSLLNVTSPLQPLAYVVIRGTRRLSGSPTFLVPTEALKVGPVRLAMSVVKAPDGVGHTLSYTYSRRSTQDDLIHSPNRPLTNARAIPEAFYHEVDALQDLPEPFSQIFNSRALREDRLLHWVMRSGLIPPSAMDDLAGQGVVFMGDAVHPMPILGGTGANEAVDDALALAEILQNGDSLQSYSAGRHQEWRVAVDEAEKAIDAMHASS